MENYISLMQLTWHVIVDVGQELPATSGEGQEYDLLLIRAMPYVWV